MIPRREVMVTKTATGQYNRGQWQPGVETIHKIRASVQPLTGDERSQYFENEEIDGAYKLYTDGDVQSGDETTGLQGDILTIRGKKYSVKSVEYWENTMISHKKIIAYRKAVGND